MGCTPLKTASENTAGQTYMAETQKGDPKALGPGPMQRKVSAEVGALVDDANSLDLLCVSLMAETQVRA